MLLIAYSEIQLLLCQVYYAVTEFPTKPPGTQRKKIAFVSKVCEDTPWFRKNFVSFVSLWDTSQTKLGGLKYLSVYLTFFHNIVMIITL